MKPHFGQSDAAMNKLAGCNNSPNAGKGLEQIAEFERIAKEAGFETPLEYLRAKHEEAAGMGLDETFFKQFNAHQGGYFGHENGCDCAVCESMMLGEARRKRESDEHYHNQATENALIQCLSDIEGYKMRVENLSEDVEKWKHAYNEMANAYSSMVLQLDEFKKDYNKQGVELQDMREAYNDEFEQHKHTFAKLNTQKAKCNIYNCMDRKDLKLRIEQLESVVREIKAELQDRAIHLLSKHCWCSPKGHNWTQQGKLSE